MRTTICVFAWAIVAFLTVPVCAQDLGVEPSSSEEGPREPAMGAPDLEAERQFQLALEDFEKGEYDKALSELEYAYRVRKNPLYIYHRVLVLEAMGEPGFALELLTQHRDDLVETEGVHDLFVVEERLKKTAAQTTTLEDPKPDSQNRSTLNTIGPILLGVAGLGFAGWSIYSWTATCGIKATDGSCLQGESTDTAFAVATSVGAAGALVGAVVWWLMATPDTSSAWGPTPHGVMVRF